MAVCALKRVFQRFNISSKETLRLNFSKQQRYLSSSCSLHNSLQTDNSLPKLVNPLIFKPLSVNLNINISGNELPLHKIIDRPLLPNLEINDPTSVNIEKSDIAPKKIIEIPTNFNIVKKEAVRMIRIRKRKMKKHKKRKFLKKMKFVRRKRAHQKSLAREKRFQAELQKMLQETEKFNAKEYVKERIHLLTRKRLPNRWRGELVPEDMIRQFIKEQQERKAHKHRLRTYRLKLDE